MINEDGVMQSGKYKDKQLSDVPMDYLNWYRKSIHRELKQIEAEMDRRMAY